MIVRLRDGLLIVSPEIGDEAALPAWLGRHAGSVFRLREIKGGSAYLESLGPEAEACRVPINVTSRAPAPLDLISNFAHTPFQLDALDYASVEGFWQGLKFPEDSERRRIALLHGSAAKNAGRGAPEAEAIIYRDERIVVGTWAHWRLMERACAAKFAQHAPTREALLATGQRPLVHEMRRDSRTIPGAIMAQIWMRLRARLSRPAAEGQRSTSGAAPPADAVGAAAGAGEHMIDALEGDVGSPHGAENGKL